MALPDAVDYTPSKYPGTFAALERVLVLPWNEKYTEDDINHIASHIREVAAELTRG